MARYLWMSQRRNSNSPINEGDGDISESYLRSITQINVKDISKDRAIKNFVCPQPYYSNPAFEYDNHNGNSNSVITNSAITYHTPVIIKSKYDIKKQNHKYFPAKIPTFTNGMNREQNNCECKCDRHFTLRVPHYKNGELTTNL